MIHTPATVLFNTLGREVFPVASRDAFGRLRVSNPRSIFDSKQIFDNQFLYFEDALTGGGSATHSVNRASTLLGVGASAGDRAIRQTRRYFNYQPGKSQLAFITFVGRSEVSNVRKRVGLFDEQNGLFFENTNGSLSMVRRSFVTGAVVDDSIPQASWNVDRLDGSGPSQFTLNPALSQILVVDYEWLGVGVARLGFVLDGNIVYCHEFRNANNLSSVYMSTPNLPVRWEVEALAANPGGGEFEAVCCSVQSEGGQNILGQTRTISREDSEKVIDAVLRPILSMRLKDAYKRASVFPTALSMIGRGSDFRYELAFLPAGGVGGLSGNGGPVWTGVADSAVEFDVTADTITGPFYDIVSGYTSFRIDNIEKLIESSLALGANIAGDERDIITLLASANGQEDLFAAIDYKELS